MKVGQSVLCVNVKPLGENDVAPPLKEGDKYTIKEIVLDRGGNPHFDVGLISKYNYVRSIETEEELPGSKFGGIHWCHPSRFELSK